MSKELNSAEKYESSLVDGEKLSSVGLAGVCVIETSRIEQAFSFAPHRETRSNDFALRNEGSNS